LVSRVDANTPTLAEMRPQLERDYKLERVARQTAAKMPGGFDAAEKQAEQGLMQQNMQRGVMAPPSRSDVMQAMCQSAIQETIDKLHKSATVVVNDPIYDRVAKEFAPAPALPGMPGATAEASATEGATPEAAAPAAATPAAKP
jgi:hypothetical protein